MFLHPHSRHSTIKKFRCWCQTLSSLLWCTVPIRYAVQVRRSDSNIVLSLETKWKSLYSSIPSFQSACAKTTPNSLSQADTLPQGLVFDGDDEYPPSPQPLFHWRCKNENENRCPPKAAGLLLKSPASTSLPPISRHATSTFSLHSQQQCQYYWFLQQASVPWHLWFFQWIYCVHLPPPINALVICSLAASNHLSGGPPFASIT